MHWFLALSRHAVVHTGSDSGAILVCEVARSFSDGGLDVSSVGVEVCYG